jgi:hypothetical protein
MTHVFLKNEGPRAAAYISTLGWLNLLGLNIVGGLLLLWFATKLRENNNRFRKATIGLLGFHILICGIVIVAEMLDRSHSGRFIIWFWEIRSPTVIVIIFSAFIVLCLRPVPWLIAPGTRAAFEQRTERGLCARCGYDIRASTERCPECNEPIPSPRPSVANDELLERLSGL